MNDDTTDTISPAEAAIIKAGDHKRALQAIARTIGPRFYDETMGISLSDILLAIVLMHGRMTIEHNVLRLVYHKIDQTRRGQYPEGQALTAASSLLAQYLTASEARQLDDPGRPVQTVIQFLINNLHPDAPEGEVAMQGANHGPANDQLSHGMIRRAAAVLGLTRAPAPSPGARELLDNPQVTALLSPDETNDA